uniref:TF_AP-2 domain-containing protein n=1 Tax=Rhabditophanes sp. KR3021 TaxID=114890 RepID=A0AC35TTJ6_9BILA
MSGCFNYGSAGNAFTIEPDAMARPISIPSGPSHYNSVISLQPPQAFSSTQDHSQVEVNDEAETPHSTNCYTFKDNRKRPSMNVVQDEMRFKKRLRVENILDSNLNNHLSQMNQLNFPKNFQQQANAYYSPQINQSLRFDPSLYCQNFHPNLFDGYHSYDNRVMTNNYSSFDHFPIPYDCKTDHSNVNSFVSDINQGSEVNDINSLLLPSGSTNYCPSDEPEVFARVPGRTSLLNSNMKYDVTIAEIHRRINPPERLNASLLGGILRRAKNKDGGKNLREQLEKVNIELPSGRRKSVPVTSFTSFAEEEIIHVLKDYDDACKANYPERQIARELTFRRLSRLNDFENMQQNLGSTLETVSIIADILKEDASPLGRQNHPTKTLNDEVQEPLSNFSLITHGFGSKAIMLSLEAAIRTLQHALGDIDPLK